MTTGQKTALSLLITVLVCAAFAVASFAGLFNVIETRFYQPSIIRGINHHITNTVDALEEYNSAQMQRFASFADNEAVKRSILVNQSSQDIFERSSLAALLQNETTGLLGIRLIDAAGKRIHYSTFNTDIQNRKDFAVSYTNYNSETDYSHALISAPDGSTARIIIDAQKDRLIYAFPFYDSYAVYRGTLLFYTSPSALNRFLVSKTLMRITDTLTLIGSPSESESGSSGIVLDLPATISDAVIHEIQNRWNEQLLTPEKLTETGENSLILFSKPAQAYGFFGQTYAENLFIFSDSIKILLLVTFFITTFLTIFLIFNLRQDEMVIIRDKIRTFQYGVIKEYLEKNEEVDWAKVSREIVYRKHDVSTEIKKSLGRQAQKHTKEVDTLLDKSWDEILSAFGKKDPSHSQSQPLAKTGTDEIKRLLEQLISNGGIQIAAPIRAAAAKSLSPSVPTVKLTASVSLTKDDEIEELEELDELEEIADVDELIDEAEELDEIADVDELDELEEIADADEVIDETEELDQIEEIADADEVIDETEELDQIEEIADADEVIDETEELDEIEEIADADETIDETEELDEIKEIADADEVIDETEELDEIEEIANADEAIDRAEELNKIEEIADADEAIDEAEEPRKIDEIEELAEATAHDYIEVEELGKSVPFSFFSNVRATASTFFSKTAHEELVSTEESDIITEENGIFKIKPEAKTVPIKDKSFKQLVDSVLK